MIRSEPMKDPRCVLLSFANTMVLDGGIMQPGWWRPLIEITENWIEEEN
jgi:hypothetical protein